MEIEQDISETIKAYAAGFIDGEGCIRIRKLKPENMPRRASPDYGIIIQVTNTNENVLNFLGSYFGGHVYSYKRKEDTINKWKSRYLWILYERQAYKFLLLLVPYLQIKRKHAELCIQFYETRRHKPSNIRLPASELERSEMYFQAVSKLNKVGPEKND